MLEDSTSIKLSFCLPVYNVEPYIVECINSIIEQGLKDFEIICIDDGSTDSSIRVLQDLSDQHSEIRVLSNEHNMGVGYTRNRLICEARGKYIWFVDPDDCLFPNCANSIYEIAEKYKADVCLANYERFVNNPQINLNQWVNVFGEDLTDAPEKRYLPIDKDGTRMCAIWAGVFRRQFLIENKLYFNEEMIAQEDTLFYFEVSQSRPRIIKVNSPCYLYRQRETSVMHRQDSEKNKRYYESMKVMYEVYQQYWVQKKYKNENLLTEKIHQMQENLPLRLALVDDNFYVKAELEGLKAKGVYPYRFRKKILSRNTGMAKRLVIFLLPLEPVFWLLHKTYVKIGRFAK